MNWTKNKQKTDTFILK